MPVQPTSILKIETDHETTLELEMDVQSCAANMMTLTRLELLEAGSLSSCAFAFWSMNTAEHRVLLRGSISTQNSRPTVVLSRKTWKRAMASLA